MISRLTVGLLASAAFFVAGPAAADDYTIDQKGQHASITFRIKHLGYSFITGRFDKFGGSFSFDEAKPEAARIKVEIETASVNTNHAERDKHLRSADFLNTDQNPKATFESTSVKPSGANKAQIAGKLTLNGVTKDIVLETERVGGGPDPWGGFRQGFTGTTKISLADFAIKKDLGPASKDVELILDVEGVKQ